MPTSHRAAIAAIAAIRALPDELERTLATLDEATLDRPYRDGGWTRRQVVHHIADSHMNAYVRMKLILTEDHPTLRPYDQDTWAALPDSAGPVAPTLQLIRGLHTRWADLLDTLDAAAWRRTAHHPEDGEVVLGDLVEKYAGHGAHHVRQLKSQN